jgi:hypothetical protein
MRFISRALLVTFVGVGITLLRCGNNLPKLTASDGTWMFVAIIGAVLIRRRKKVSPLSVIMLMGCNSGSTIPNRALLGSVHVWRVRKAMK